MRGNYFFLSITYLPINYLPIYLSITYLPNSYLSSYLFQLIHVWHTVTCRKFQAGLQKYDCYQILSEVRRGVEVCSYVSTTYSTNFMLTIYNFRMDYS